MPLSAAVGFVRAFGLRLLRARRLQRLFEVAHPREPHYYIRYLGVATDQLPALLLDGLTVVVSPLIALMKDQIDFLTAPRRPRRPARLEPRRRPGPRRSTPTCAPGELKLLYVAPERLRQRAVPADARPAARSRCWRSTRPTASASGGTTSAPTT